MKVKVFILALTLILPVFLNARSRMQPSYARPAQTPQPSRPAPQPSRPAPKPSRPAPKPSRPAPPPSKPVPPPHKPVPPPPPPKMPYYTSSPYLYRYPTVTYYYNGEPVQYSWAWYNDRYVIFYEGWFWYNNEWVWGGRGTAPLPPAWRPE